MVRSRAILELSGNFINNSMGREKYYKKEEELKKMTKPMYAAPDPGFWCEIEADADQGWRIKSKVLRT